MLSKFTEIHRKGLQTIQTTSIEGERPGFVILMVLPKVCLDFTHYGYYAVVYEMINDYTKVL